MERITAMKQALDLVSQAIKALASVPMTEDGILDLPQEAMQSSMELMSIADKLEEALATQLQTERAQPEQPNWQAIEAQAAADLEAVTTDKEAYAFIEKYLSKDLRGRYMTIYRSDRHEMNRSPRQALDNLLSLPPLE